jgi:hypothetical protein
MTAVAKRLADEPDVVMPTLRLLADPSALSEAPDISSVLLARRVNSDRLTARLAEFRAGAITTVRVRELLGGVTRQAVAFRVEQHRLLATEIGGRLYFPDWQFGPEGVYADVPAIVRALLDGARTPVAADALMRKGIAEEDGRSPAELLAAGNADRALHYIAIAGAGF